MMRYGYHIPSRDRIGGVSAAFAGLLVQRFHAREAGRNWTNQAEVDDWENEGGSVTPATSNELKQVGRRSNATTMRRAGHERA